MKKNNYIQSLKIIKELNKAHPRFVIGRHISTALSDYGDLWGITDKEFLFALTKYQEELELDNDNIASPEYIQAIEEDAKRLFEPRSFEEEDDI